MDADGLSIINPSVIQQNHDLEDEEFAQQEADEKRAIEEAVERGLAELSDPDLDDYEDESVIGALAENSQQHNFQEFHPNQNSTPFNSRFVTPYGNVESNRYQTSEEAILNGPEGLRTETLYNARGVEIQRLKDELIAKEDLIKKINHERTLLKGDKERVSIHLENCQKESNALSEDNQALRQELEEIKAQFRKIEWENQEKSKQLESSELMVQNLQTNLNELHKGETFLRAKIQHEETIRSLEERHKNIVFDKEQELESKKAQIRKLENEHELLTNKLRKNGLDHDRVVMKKTDTIRELQDRLELAQKKYENCMAETSAEGYSKVKAMYDRFQLDKEKFAADLCNKQEEIDLLKNKLSEKKEAIGAYEKDKIKLKADFQTLLEQKDLELQKLNLILAENEQKLSKMMRESLMGSNSTAIQRFQDDLEKNKSELNAKIQEVLRQKYELEESHVKYVNLKKKIRLFQSHWKNKEEKYKESLQKNEDEFRAKLFKLRDKMQEVYDSKINEIESEMLNVQEFVQGELAKMSEVEQPKIEPLVQEPFDVPRGYEDFLPSPDSPQVIQSNDENHSTDQLTRLLQNAKLDLREKLKRPTSQDRSPFAQIN